MSSSGLARGLVSFVHYLKFYEFGLSPRPWLLVAAVLFWLIVTGLGLVLAETEWTGPKWVWIASLTLPLLGWAIGIARSDAPSRPHFRTNESVLRRLAQIGPSPREQALGFERQSMRTEAGGEVILSHRFNAEEMSDPARDWTLILSPANAETAAIRSSLRSHRVDLVAHGRQSFLNAALAGKALTNEPKIAFAADFPNGLPFAEVFRTDYFTGQCSVDRALEDVVLRDTGEERVISEGGDRLFNLLNGDWSALPDLGAAAHSVSLHMGIEVIAISADDFLRIPIQSTQTQYSRNMRAPLASGSVDWDDAHGNHSLKALLRRAAARELAEEWGAGAASVRRRLLASRLEPVGYFRHPLRFGKPQFVAAGRFDCSDAELSADVSEVYKRNDRASDGADGSRLLFRIKRLDDLRAAMANILERPGPYKDSTALLGAAACIAGLVEREPARMAAMFGLAE